VEKKKVLVNGERGGAAEKKNAPADQGV